MPRVEIQRVPEPSDRTLPIFTEFEKIADRIRLQAYQLFAHRGASDGHALDDWLAAEREVCWPATELVEEGGQYSLKVALPGFEHKEISVTATPREIMVKAAHRHETSGGDVDGDGDSDSDAKLRWSEFRSNDVLRRVELPADVNVDEISASLKNGLLEITAPKVEASEGGRAKKIELSAPS